MRKERYSLTRPITKSGTTYYWDSLVKLNNGEEITDKQVKTIEKKGLTYKAMREKGLVEVVDDVYRITRKGYKYIKFYENTPQGNFFNSSSESPKIVDKIS